MTPLQVGAAAAVLVALSGWSLALAAQRAPRSLNVARERMFGAADVPGASPRGGAWRRDGVASRWAERRFGAGLAIVDMTPSDVVSRIAVSATIVGLTVTAAVSALMAMGLLPATPFWLLFAAGLAVAAGWIAVHDVASRVERRRRELRQAANDFVQLVAVGLTTDQSVEEAIRFAIGVGASDAFDLLRHEISTAPQRGVPVWEAVDEFGRRCAVRELCEFAGSLERQGLQGVSISDTVATLAASMRAKSLDELEREADKANANLSGPTIGFVVTTVVFLAYPLAQRISEAFGG